MISHIAFSFSVVNHALPSRQGGSHSIMAPPCSSCGRMPSHTLIHPVHYLSLFARRIFKTHHFPLNIRNLQDIIKHDYY